MNTEKTKRLSTDVPISFHTRLKTFAAARQMNMRDYLIAALTDSMDRDEQRRNCPLGLSHTPNKETLKALSETDKAIKDGTLKSYNNSKELLDYLESSEDS